MSTVLTELFRHSFPKGLRFCGQCKSLHSSLTVVIKRNKNRRYINKAEIDAVAASFTPAPYAWMRNPILKRLLILNVVNQIRRGVYKKPFWMLSNSIQAEHDKLQQWLKLYEECGGNMRGVTATGDASEKTTGSGSTRGFSVDRVIDKSKSSASASSSGSGASSTPFATNAPALKRGKWSASKYMRNTEGKGEKDSTNASAGASKSTPAPASSVPAKSDKRLAADLGSTKGIAADLAEEANRSAAPEAREGNATFSSALRQVFGSGGGPSSSSAESAAGASSPSSAEASSSKKDASSSTKAGASSSSPSGSQGTPQWTNTNRNAKDFIEREVFEKSFMGNFHVAMYYHLSFICGVAIVLCCLVELFCIFFAHHIFYVNERVQGRASTVDDIVETHIDIEEKHLTVEVPPEFQSRLPPPAVVMKASDAPKRRLDLFKDDDGYIPRPLTPPEDMKNTAGDKEKKAVEVVPKRRIVDPRTGKALDVVEGNNKITDSAIKEVGKDDESDVYVLNAVELTSPNGKIKVVFIPSPVVAPEGFYKEQGAILKNADVVLLEGVSLTDTHRQPASTFFPLHDNFFKPYGLSHRFYDVLTSSREPPMLLPAAIPTSWGRWLQLLVIPFPFVAIHRPELMVGSKGEARVGWSWLLDTLDMVADMDTSAGPQHPNLGGGGGGNNGSKVFEDNVTGVMAPASHAGLALKSGSAVVAIPWTVNQIANMEASLLNRGFTVTGVLPIRWMERGQFGRAFADYFNVKEGNSGPVRTSATATV